MFFLNIYLVHKEVFLNVTPVICYIHPKKEMSPFYSLTLFSPHGLFSISLSHFRSWISLLSEDENLSSCSLSNDEKNIAALSPRMRKRVWSSPPHIDPNDFLSSILLSFLSSRRRLRRISFDLSSLGDYAKKNFSQQCNVM